MGTREENRVKKMKCSTCGYENMVKKGIVFSQHVLILCSGNDRERRVMVFLRKHKHE